MLSQIMYSVNRYVKPINREVNINKLTYTSYRRYSINVIEPVVYRLQKQRRRTFLRKRLLSLYLAFNYCSKPLESIINIKSRPISVVNVAFSQTKENTATCFLQQC